MKLLAFHDVREDLQAPHCAGLYIQGQQLYNQACEAGGTQGGGRWEAGEASSHCAWGPRPSHAPMGAWFKVSSATPTIWGGITQQSVVNKLARRVV